MYTKVSLPKASGSAAAPVPKDPNLIVIKVKDLLKVGGVITGYPARDAGGVKMTGNIALMANAKAVGIYLTPVTISRNDKSDGDSDAVGFMQELTGEHPGDSLALNEFVQNNINEDFILISTECSDSNGGRVLGTLCNPMKLTFEGQDDKDAKKGKISFKQDMRSKFKMAHYFGTIPALEDAAAEPGQGSSSVGSGI